MRSILTLFFCLLLSFGLTAQTQVDLPITFEDANVNYDVANFGGADFQIVTDPTDVTNTVGQIVKNAGAEIWGGIVHGANMPLANPIPFTADDTQMSVRIWSPTAGTNVRLKVENAANPEIFVEVDVPTTLAGQWETLTFDFTNNTTEQTLNLANVYDKVALFPNFGTSPTMAETYYYDDIMFLGDGGGGGGATAPMTAAPTPTQAAEDVISIFSDAYDDVTVDTYQTEWSVGILTDTMIEGNATLRYDSLDFVGIETVAQQVDITGMTHLHLDHWSADATFFAVKLVDFGADGAFGGGDDVEHQIDIANPARGQWNGLDIPLADFAGLTTRMNIAQIILVGQPTGTNTTFIDNIYFYDGGPQLQQVDLPITFEADDVDYDVAPFGGAVFAIVEDPTDATNTVGQIIKTAGSEIWAGVVHGANNGLAAPIAFTTDETVLTMRTWSPEAGITVRLKVENAANPELFVEVDMPTTVAGAWETLTFDFANPVGNGIDPNVDYDKVAVFFNFGVSPTMDETYYYDDITFTGEGGGGGDEEPMAAAPTPTREAEDVISLFSDAYTDVTVDTYRTEWSDADLTEVMIEGNPTLRYDNLSFVGIETIAMPIDLESAGMTHFHVNYWTTDLDSMRIKLVDFLGDGFDGANGDTEDELTFAVEQGTWGTLEIPLNDFNMMAQSDINQLLFVGVPAGTVWIDNIYFYAADPDNTTTPRTGVLEVFPNPATDRVNITAPVRMESVSLFAQNGQLVDRWTAGAERFELDLTNLTPGLYVALVQTADGPLTVKIVRE